MTRKKFSTIRELAYYSSLGLTLALSIFIGLFLGVWLDGLFDTRPVLTLVFIGFGIAAGFRNLLMAAKRSREL
ncbi:MAG: AtpZ/AtpI family protein [Desulfamplus sp.]|nr:AtpZ/AtpI family protein [Desulfamplus sp.]